ncbi:neprilysin-4-like isoform X3 [Bolinopsis microptera]|uniref:neprilysin-4-like isoform X3 n=1 Tax=Bolinopsis microptera TaxID=2820187 RepID=UPI003078AC84
MNLPGYGTSSTITSVALKRKPFSSLKDKMEEKADAGTRKKMFGLTIGLIVTGLVAVVLLGVLIWAVNSKKGLVSPPDQGFVRASAAMGSNMDATADPCSDFATYACGGWMKKHVIPDDMDQWSNFVILRDETAVTLLNLVTALLDETIDDANPRPDYEKKMLDFYTSCSDTTEMDKTETADELHDKVQKIMTAPNIPPVMETAASQGINVFYLLYVEPDNNDPNINCIYMVQGALGMTLKEEYNNDDPKEDIKAKQGYYKEYLKKLWKNYDSNASDGDLNTTVSLIYDFESCVAEGMNNPDEERSAFADMPSKLYSEVKVADFEDKLQIMSSYKYRRTDMEDVPDDTKIYYHENYITKVKDCVDTHLSEESDFKTYVGTRFMLQYAPAGKESWRKLWWDNQQHVTKVAVKPARWKTCLSAITSYMPEVVGRIFADEAFKEDAKKDTLEMIQDIKNAFKQILPNLAWMDEKTRANAIEKADNVDNKIGYAEWITDDTKLNEYLKSITISADNLLSNTMSADKALSKKSFDYAGGKVNKDKWYMSPATVNAYYNPKGNEMVFPAAILQPPFYHVTYPAYVNYGAIGVVIGHELTHGFDDNGRLYDKDGYLKEWYTDEAKKGFQERANCMINQYSGYTVMGSKVNGNLTLGENIADNGGVKQAYIAYQNWVKRNGEEATLPGLDLTNEQAFFLSYAQIWCQKKTKEAFELMTKVDPHSPGIFRIEGPLVNSKEFSKAFKCSSETPMNPTDKCEVW